MQMGQQANLDDASYIKEVTVTYTSLTSWVQQLLR